MKPLYLAVLALAAPAAAQAPDWSKAQPIRIAMTDRGFMPDRIVLHRAAPYVLHLANRSGKGHNLTQKSFFRFAGVAPGDRRWIADGQISLRPGERATVRFLAPTTRPGGMYQFSSTVLGDADNEYKGAFYMR